jgi:long-subunit fatty acid transport protein
MRFGLAYHTRTRIAFTDEYSTNMRSTFKSGESYDYNSPLNRLEYVIYTPSRAMASLAFIMGKYGVISADYERINYGLGELRPTALSGPDAYNFESENKTLSSLYGLSHCARVGAEFRIQRMWRLRAGAGLETSPFQQSAGIQTDAKRYTGSLGFGYRSEKWYATSTYRRSWFERDIYLFDPGLLDAGRMSQTHGILVVAVGFRL